MHRFAFFWLRSCAWALAWLPEPWSEALAHVIARLWLALGRKDRKILFHNLRTVFGLSSGILETDRRSYTATVSFPPAFALQVLRSQVQFALDFVRELFHPGSVRVDGLEDLRTLMHQHEHAGIGCILVTAHIGGWELLGHRCVVAAGRRFHALAKTSHFPSVQLFIDWMRARLGQSILWADRRGIHREMLRVLKDQEWIGFVMDQKPRGRKGPLVDFMGIPTEFVSGPAAMAIHSGGPAISAYCVRTGPRQYRILCATLLSANHGMTDETGVTQIFASSIEQCIRTYPEQWCWNYKRWRFTDIPPGMSKGGEHGVLAHHQ